MSTIKISQLANLPSIAANTSNTLFVGVDIPSGITGKFTATTLAQQLYANNYLVVGNYAVTYPNTIGMFAGPSSNYVQKIIENTDGRGTADVVAQANTSTDTAYFIDMGFSGPNYNNGSPYNSLGNSLYPLDGYLYVQGSSGSPGGNLVIGTSSTSTKVNFIVGGVNSSNIIYTVSPTTVTFNKQITFVDGTTQNTAPATNAYSVAAFGVANSAQANTVLLQGAMNTANSNISIGVGVDTTQNTRIASADALATGAYGVANTALQNTSTIITNNNLFITNGLLTSNITTRQTNESLYINPNGTGNTTFTSSTPVVMLNGLTIANSSFSANATTLRINGSSSGSYQAHALGNVMLHITGKDNAPTRLYMDSFGSGVYSTLIGRGARGTVTAPTATQVGDTLLRIGGNSFGSTVYAPISIARVELTATENHTDTNRGTAIVFSATSNGTSTPAQIASFTGNTASFNGEVNPIKGLLYSANVFPTITTAHTLDFNAGSLYKFDINNNTTFTLSNFKQGKELVVCVKNTDTNQNRTVTHGVAANNSTIGATSFTLTAGHAALMTYISFNNDSGNTFVSITYS